MFKICELAQVSTDCLWVEEVCSTMLNVQRYTQEEEMNPFALAAWLHLALVRCLPFDVRTRDVNEGARLQS